MAAPTQVSLWDFVRLRNPRRKRVKSEETIEPNKPRRPVASARELPKPLTEKTLPTEAVVVLLSDKKRTRYQIAGKMLCGETCFVWLRLEGVTNGEMAMARVERLTLVEVVNHGEE